MSSRKFRGPASARRLRRSGFTLIELMVVIAIIGLLSAVVLTSLGGAKSKGVNARVQSDIHQYHEALEIYYTKWGHYPQATNNDFYCLGTYPPANGCWSNGKSNDGSLDTAVKDTIPSLPAGQTIIDSNNTSYIGYMYQCSPQTPPGSPGAKPCDGRGYLIEWTLNGAGQTCNEQGTVVTGVGINITACKLIVSS